MTAPLKSILKSYGMPAGDDHSLPTSAQRFSDGSHFGIEISSVNNLAILQRVSELADRYELKINRVDECRGIFRLPDREIREIVSLCGQKNIGLFMSIGPRAIYDTGGFVRTQNGARVGYRLRGMDNLISGLEDVVRACELGVRGFLIYDEGQLHALGRMIHDGHLPRDIVLKVSVHMGCANPLSAKLYEQIGGTSINVVPDLDLPMLAAIRAAVSIPLDVFSDTAADAGGFIRTHEVPEIVRVTAPVYLKCGPVSQRHQNYLPSDEELEERIKQTRCVLEMLARKAPELQQLTRDSATQGLVSFNT